MWDPWRERTLSLTFLAMPATPSPWTAQPSSPSRWISWTPVLTTTTVPPVHRTHVVLDSQTTCATEGRGWASTLTTRTGLCLFPCLPTHWAPPLWVTTVPRTCFPPLIAPTAPRCDLCCTRHSDRKFYWHIYTHLTFTCSVHVLLFGTNFRWWTTKQHNNTHMHTLLQKQSQFNPDSFI